MAEKTVRDFVTQVGMQRLMGKVGVGDRMVRHAARANQMPAKWYAGAKEAAREAKVAKPSLDLFDMSKPENKQ